MWRNKKFIIFSVVAAILLVGSIGGIALAQTGNVDDSQPKARYGALLERVCAIYEQKTGVGIDQEVLKEAFTEAQSEMRDEALNSRLQKLVDEGKITEEQMDALQEWWGSRPDVTFGFGFPGGHGRFSPPYGMGEPPCATPE